MILDQELQTEIEELIHKAGDALMNFWPGHDSGVDSPLKTRKKKDGSLVSEADFEANRILVEGIRARFPNDGIISEEEPIEREVRTKKNVWIIDPLDGTSRFLAGTDEFSVLVAYCISGRVELSYMYFAGRGDFAKAIREEGATIGPKKLQVSSAQELQLESVAVRACRLKDNQYSFPKKLDSGDAFIRVCRGELAAAVFGLKKLKEWDLAAPSLMVEESGGRVTDEKGQPILFNQESVTHRYLVASNGKVHQQVLNLLT